MKKIISSFIASVCVISALPVYSTSAEPLFGTNREEVFENMIEIPESITIYNLFDKEDLSYFYSCTSYPVENTPVSMHYYTSYNKKYGYYSNFSYIKEFHTGRLEYSLSEGKTNDDLKALLSEYNSANGSNFDYFPRYNNCITDMKTDISDVNEARGIAEYLKESGCVSSCIFYGAITYIAISSRYPTCYEYSPETEELLTSYVEEKGLDVYIARDPSVYDDKFYPYYYDMANYDSETQEYVLPPYIYLIPKEKISDLELLELAQQVYDDTSLVTKYGSGRITDIAQDRYDINSTIDMFDYEEGDANNDTSVNMADAVMVMQSLANPDVYGIGKPDGITEQGMFNADICDTGDGITLSDAETIQLRLLGL